MQVPSVIVIVSCLRVNECGVSDRLDLPELTSIQLGYNALEFEDDESSTLIMRSDSHRVY